MNNKDKGKRGKPGQRHRKAFFRKLQEEIFPI